MRTSGCMHPHVCLVVLVTGTSNGFKRSGGEGSTYLHVRGSPSCELLLRVSLLRLC